MALTLKFNRKVYLIPHDKYESLIESNRKKSHDEPGRLAATAAIGSGAGQSSSLPQSDAATPFVPPAIWAGTLPGSGGGASSNENKSLSLERAETLTTLSDELSTHSQGDSGDNAPSVDDKRYSGESILRKVENTLTSKEHKSRAHAILRVLTASGSSTDSCGGDTSVIDYPASLLHTQSSEFPVPRGHRKFYCLLLEFDVPLNLISNVKLRQIYSDSE